MATIENPFPGMNPYLEQYWGDVHARLITYISDALQEALPQDLRARLEERVYLESEEDGTLRRRAIVPDVHVAENPSTRYSSPATAGGGVAVMPMIIEYAYEPITEAYIEIRDSRNGARVVTLIEVVSPGNKAGGDGEQQYLSKQAEIRAAKANLVEIDLIRGGNHVLAAPRHAVAGKHAAPYRVCVTRGNQTDRSEWYPIHLRDRLPAVNIPLRTTDADVVLDLQPILQRAYRMGRYDDIDYSRNPSLPLDPTDAAWADGLLKSKGLRR